MHLTHFSTSLAKQSMAVIQEKKSLLIFPLLSTIITLSLFYTVFFHIEKIELYTLKINHIDQKVYFFVIGLLCIFFYLAYSITLLFNAALTVCAVRHIQSQPRNTIGAGFILILRRLPVLLLWTLLMTTLGIVIRFLEYWVDGWSKQNYVIQWFSGLHWMVATFFVTPLLVMENNNPLQAIQRSAQLIQKNWGMVTVFPHIKIGILLIMIRLISLIPLIVLIIIGGKINVMIGFFIAMIVFLITSIVNSAAVTVSTSALYLFATGVDTAKYYDASALKNAFSVISDAKK